MAVIPKNPIVGVIGGKGKMGALFAQFFRSQGLEVLVSDIKTKLTNEQLAKQADIIIVSVPIAQTQSVIKKIVHKVRKQALLMDLTSVKKMPTTEMLKGKSAVIGLHPMFANTNGIYGQTMVICPMRPNGWESWVRRIFRKGDLKLIELTPEKHDQYMTVVQGIVHFTDFVLGRTLSRMNFKFSEIYKLASFTTKMKMEFCARLHAQDPNLYGPIQLFNEGNNKTIKTFLEEALKMQKIVKKKDLPAFRKFFLQGGTEFFGNYGDKALGKTSWMIDQLIIHDRHNLSRRGTHLRAKNIKKGEYDIAILGPELTYTDNELSS